MKSHRVSGLNVSLFIMLACVRRTFVSVKFTGVGVDKVVDGLKGESILQVAERNGIHIPNACEGMGACATCHCYVKTGEEKLSELTDRENDTMDFVIGARDNSRLACLATVIDDSGDITVEIPKHSRNII